MISVVWCELFHPGNEVGGALKLEVDAEVWQALKDLKDGFFMHLKVVLFDFLY